jgi:SAM-dependent methyltransferase
MNTAMSTKTTPPWDWNLAWQQARTNKRHDRSDNSHWNKRAVSFAQNARKSNYAEEFLRLLVPQPQWSVLDVGCGAGTLAIPLAPLVQHITAIDFSENMIALLKAQCAEQGLHNIQTSITGWEDDWDLAGIGIHDVAIASRSLVVDDLCAALMKLHNRARLRVYIASLVGDGPFDRRIFEAIGRDLDRGPDYIFVYNLLHQMGIHAEVRFVFSDSGTRVFSDIDDAVEQFHWMLDSVSAEEEVRLRDYFERHLRKTQGGWTLAYQHTVRWAVISWSTTS